MFLIYINKNAVKKCEEKSTSVSDYQTQIAIDYQKVEKHRNSCIINKKKIIIMNHTKVSGEFYVWLRFYNLIFLFTKLCNEL